MRLEESSGVCIERQQKESRETKNKSVIETRKRLSSRERLPGFTFVCLFVSSQIEIYSPSLTDCYPELLCMCLIGNISFKYKATY